jgi:transposase-like protein
MSDVLDDLRLVQERLVARIRELERNVAELDELRDIAERLGLDLGDGSQPSTVKPSRSWHRDQPRARRAAAGQPARKATRRERVLELVAEHPGITVSELVEELNVNRTSLYPVVRQLVSDGLITKNDTHLTPAH